MKNISYFLMMIGFGMVMVVLQIVCAHRDNFLTVRQMKMRSIKKGLPLMWHAGIWGDAIILTPLLSSIVAMYGDQWQWFDIVKSTAVGILAILFFGNMWVNGAKHGLPEALTHDGRMTGAGYFHAIYFVVAVAIIMLTFFYTAIPQRVAITIAIILGIHVIYGTHITLGIMAPEWYPDRPQKNPMTWMIVLASWGLLAWRCLTI